MKHISCLTMIFLALSVPPLPAATLHGLVTDGNQAYREGNYSEALRKYEQALEKDPGTATAQFNRGAALFRREDYTAAESAWKAALKTADSRLRDQILYNLGNNALMQAQASAEKDPAAALERLKESAALYSRVLQTEPDNPAAGKNLEISRRRIKQLQRLIASQPPSKKSKKDEQSGRGDAKKTGQGQSDDPADQLKDLLARQQQAADRNRDQPGGPTEAQERTEDQREIKEQTDQIRKQSQGDSAKAENEAAQHLEKAGKKQEEALDKMANGQFKEAREAQERAAEELAQALKSSRKEQQNQPGKKSDPDKSAGKKRGAEDPGDPAPEQTGNPEAHKDEPAPDQTARQIINQEKADRRARRQQGQAGYEAAEKDW